MKSVLGVSFVLILGLVVLFQNGLEVGTVVSTTEMQFIVGGDCYRDGVHPQRFAAQVVEAQ